MAVATDNDQEQPWHLQILKRTAYEAINIITYKIYCANSYADLTVQGFTLSASRFPHHYFKPDTLRVTFKMGLEICAEQPKEITKFSAVLV